MQNIPTKELPDVTIVVSAYNAGSTHEKYIQSPITLDYPKERLECIVIDNDSTDASASILQRYSGSIALIRESKRGPAAARNIGIRNARHELIAFTDADCCVDTEWLKNLVSPLIDDGTIAAAGGRILPQEPANDVSRYGQTIHDHDKAINYFDSVLSYHHEHGDPQRGPAARRHV